MRIALKEIKANLSLNCVIQSKCDLFLIAGPNDDIEDSAGLSVSARSLHQSVRSRQWR